MSLPRDWHYVSGSGRKQVRAPDGTIYSRQQAENISAQQWGFRSEYERKKAASSPGFIAFTSRRGYERGLREAQGAGFTSAEANAAFARYYANEEVNAYDRSPDGPLAQMLVVMGRRSPYETFYVGDSPSIY